MVYTNKQLQSVWYAMQSLAKTDSRRINCHIPTPLALDWGCRNGGTITCVSNQSGFYGFSGISISYSWGGTHSAGCTSGHNMCFSLSKDGRFWSGEHWTSDTPENQKLIGSTFVPRMAELYGITPQELIAIGVKAKREEAKEIAKLKMYGQYKLYLENFVRTCKLGESPMSLSAYKKSLKK